MRTEITMNGVFVGDEIAEGVFAEEVASRRFVIRQQSDSGHPYRVGEVCGGKRSDGTSHYQAMTMKGDHIGSSSSKMGAVRMLTCGSGLHLPKAPPVPAMVPRRKIRFLVGTAA